MKLMKEMLQMDPTKRISAAKALKHDWFKEAPHQDMELMPTFPPMNEQSRDMRKIVKK